MYRDRESVAKLSAALSEAAHGLGDIRIMHVCGTHEHEIRRFGIRQLLPQNIRIIAGPGCPVCITPASAIATARALALHESSPIVCTYGDMVKVPVKDGSLLDTRGNGGDVRIVYGIREAVELARSDTDRQVVFFSVGFETTAAPVAAVVKRGLPENLLLYTCHRYVPTAVKALAELDDGSIGGFLLPGHASVITGSVAYGFLAKDYRLPSAVAGFEPMDMLAGLLSIIRQIRDDEPEAANCYRRAVRDTGNVKAQNVINDVFVLYDAPWRGIGILPGTGLRLRDTFKTLDALSYYGMEEVVSPDVLPGCICHLVLLGRRSPADCSHFRSVCTPEHPQGPCMVSGEGTCRAAFLYPEDQHV